MPDATITGHSGNRKPRIELPHSCPRSPLSACFLRQVGGRLLKHRPIYVRKNDLHARFRAGAGDSQTDAAGRSGKEGYLP